MQHLYIFKFRIEPNMKLFSHTNNIVLRRVIYIHSLPGVKLVKLFSLANETWCAVTVPPVDFVKGDCAVGNAVRGKKGCKLNTECNIYSRKSARLTVVALSCKTTGGGAREVLNNTYYKMRIVAIETGFYKVFISTEKNHPFSLYHIGQTR